MLGSYTRAVGLLLYLVGAISIKVACIGHPKGKTSVTGIIALGIYQLSTRELLSRFSPLLPNIYKACVQANSLHNCSPDRVRIFLA